MGTRDEQRSGRDATVHTGEGLTGAGLAVGGGSLRYSGWLARLARRPAADDGPQEGDPAGERQEPKEAVKPV